MPDKNKMDADIKFSCSSNEKELLKKSAEDVSLSMSDFIRSLIFGNEKVVLLSEGAEIAKAMFLIHTDLEYFRTNGGIPEESVKALELALYDVSTQLNMVSSKLTDIRADDKEVDTNE